MTEPRERPILFSGPMVRAILDGRKTQTRRVVKPQPAPNAPHDGGTTWAYRPSDGRHVPYGTVGHLTVAEKMGLICPYGQPGDRLWVRETWAVDYVHDGVRPASIRPTCSVIYRASEDMPGVARSGRRGKWRPSIHMPRWASRLTLAVTGVRVERLQAITQADALTEGTVDTRGAWGPLSDTDRAGPRGAFEALWNSINGPGAWDTNPWVWVVEFRRLEARHG